MIAAVARDTLLAVTALTGVLFLAAVACWARAARAERDTSIGVFEGPCLEAGDTADERVDWWEWERQMSDWAEEEDIL